MTTSHVDVSGGRLLVADDGAGRPIVLLHAGIVDQRPSRGGRRQPARCGAARCTHSNICAGST